MSGLSLASSIIAGVVIIESFVAIIIIFRNIKIGFSFKIIGLATIGSIATIFNQILQEKENTIFSVIGQAICICFTEAYIPMSIMFTKRQWTLLKRFKIKIAASIEEKKQLRKELANV